jgi:hypothetical protein
VNKQTTAATTTTARGDNFNQTRHRKPFQQPKMVTESEDYGGGNQEEPEYGYGMDSNVEYYLTLATIKISIV